MGKYVHWFILVFLWLPAGAFADSAKVESYRKTLAFRKAAFEVYIQQRDRKKSDHRNAIARIKKSRKARVRLAVKSREEFKRTSEEFPREAYRRFVAEKTLRGKATEKQNRSYRKFKKKIRQVEKNRRYFIDMERAYRLR